ncbi:hypothetical protein Tco_0578998 [Tanacetum coccineum]
MSTLISILIKHIRNFVEELNNEIKDKKHKFYKEEAEGKGDEGAKKTDEKKGCLDFGKTSDKSVTVEQKSCKETGDGSKDDEMKDFPNVKTGGGSKKTDEKQDEQTTIGPAEKESIGTWNNIIKSKDKLTPLIKRKTRVRRRRIDWISVIMLNKQRVV